MLPDAIQTLKQHHHWVGWKFEQRNGKQTKIPEVSILRLHPPNNSQVAPDILLFTFSFTLCYYSDLSNAEHRMES